MAPPLPNSEAGTDVGRPVMVAPVLWHLPEQPSTIPCAEEVARTHWLPLAAIPSSEDDLPRRQLSKLTEEAFPYIDLDGGPLWGFTLRLLQRCQLAKLL